jgi:hypothetical protein
MQIEGKHGGDGDPPQQPWNPASLAVQAEYNGAVGKSPITLLSHADHPFVEALPEDEQQWPDALQAASTRYLQRVASRFDIGAPVDALFALRAAGFGWLPLPRRALFLPTDSAQQRTDFDETPSVWLRRLDANGDVAEISAVLIAGIRAPVRGRTAALGGGVSLRVMIHVDRVPVGWRLRITGMVAHSLALATDDAANDRLLRLLARVAEDITVDPAELGLDPRRPVSVDSVALDSADAGDVLILGGTGTRGDGAARRTYAWRARYRLGDNNQLLLLERTAPVELAAHAMETTLPRDPASQGSAVTLISRRPTRSDDELDAFRSADTRVPAPSNGLVEPGPAPRFEVVRTAVGNPGADTTKTQDKRAVEAELRSDDLAAAHAYTRALELFERIDDYGLVLPDLWRMASLPMRLRHRAAVAAAPDGEMVNAVVRPDGPGLDVLGPGHKPPHLEVLFGAANLSHRRLLPNEQVLAGGGKRLRAQPMGLAADARWAWHEFGHVLIYAATGALELPYAHSVGDALAAVISDPESELADDDGSRGLTFPWVATTRRHDRHAQRGWCWCGRRNKLRSAAWPRRQGLFTGYFEEQLMSSSIFRLYRVLGGDTHGNDAASLHARQRASDYVVYLVMRAIALLPPSTSVGFESAQTWVMEMRHADTGTGVWAPTLHWPRGAARALQRRGGTAHKVVRWAFEQQGLYGASLPATSEGPGRPPAVDIYIPGSGARADGGYRPVPLRWHDSVAQPWHADASSIEHLSNSIRVTVRNRGGSPATNVSVKVWVTPVVGPRAWKELPVLTALPVNVGASAVASITFDAASTQKGEHFVLAQATCPDDRACSDPLTALACAAGWQAQNDEGLIDLIANDNNQGLRIIDFQ